MQIGEVIRSRRKMRKITQAELAELLNVTPQTVSRWEVGISYPDIAMLPEISAALWVSADELLGIGWAVHGNTGANLNQSQADSIFRYIPEPIEEKRKRVLIVDDSGYMRMALEDILTHHGYTVLQAKDGRECLTLLQYEDVEVCVLDIVMPYMDGTETLKRIREMQLDLRVVMLSALSTERIVRQSLELGADAFVVKPFQEDCLLERIG